MKNTLYCATDLTDRLQKLKLDHPQMEEIKQMVQNIQDNNSDFQELIEQCITDKNYDTVNDEMIFFHPLIPHVRLVFSYYPDKNQVVLFDVIRVNE